MKLSAAQAELIKQLSADPEKGLTTDEATKRREADGTFNVVDPPIKCPAWVCCLLPCIHHIPSMKIFATLKPDDAEVLRNGKWIRYDASSLVKGDVIRLEEGDIVPADCIVLTLESSHDLLVDHRHVTGEDKPRTSEHARVQPIQLFYGGQVVQGSATAVVTAIGRNTLLAGLIHDRRFPPTSNLLVATDGIMRVGGGVGEENEEAGISLITRDTV